MLFLIRANTRGMAHFSDWRLFGSLAPAYSRTEWNPVTLTYDPHEIVLNAMSGCVLCSVEILIRILVAQPMDASKPVPSDD